MNISRYRPEFIVFAVDRSSQGAKALAESLWSMGYRSTRFFPTLESALLAARNELPHVIVLDVGAQTDDAEKFLIDIQSLSSEILTILVTPGNHVLACLQLVSRTLAYDCIVRPFVSSLELLQKIDRAATRLYYQFESEQLREFYEKDVRRDGQVSLSEPDRFGDAEESVFSDLHETLREFSRVKETDEIIRIFIGAVSRVTKDTPTLYFKYISSHISLAFSQASFLPEDKFRGVGIDLKKLQKGGVEDFFENPEDSHLLREFVSQIFRKDRFTAFIHTNEREVLGLFVILDRVDIGVRHDLACLREAFDISYRRNQILKEKHAVDFFDQLTGLSNRRHFFRALSEEISRSRRLLMPVSVLSMSIDSYDELVSGAGAAAVDIVVRTIGHFLRETARTNDLVARLGGGDFALILPHTPQIGATIKAERIRRAIETMHLPVLEKYGLTAVTVSCGVSEYPSLAGDADALFRSADEALFEVKRQGGNKLCLTSPPPGFLPDFVAREVPTSSKVRGGEIG